MTKATPRFAFLVMWALALPCAAGAADTTRVVKAPEERRVEWISIRRAPRGMTPGLAVLHNRGPGPIIVVLAEGRPFPGYLHRVEATWKTFPPMGYCGTGSYDRTIAQRDSLVFEFNPPGGHGYWMPDGDAEYRVTLNICERRTGPWQVAVSAQSFRGSVWTREDAEQAAR